MSLSKYLWKRCWQLILLLSLPFFKQAWGSRSWPSLSTHFSWRLENNFLFVFPWWISWPTLEKRTQVSPGLTLKAVIGVLNLWASSWALWIPTYAARVPFSCPLLSAIWNGKVFKSKSILLQGVPKVFRHVKWAVCGELVHLKIFLRKYQMKISIIPTLSENFNEIKQTWHQL